MTLEIGQIFLALLAPVIAGIAWSTVGIWQRWRVDRDATVDWLRVRKNVIIGVGLGIAAFAYSAISGEGSETAITSIKTFFIAIGGYFPLIVIVDKVLAKHEKDNEADE